MFSAIVLATILMNSTAWAECSKLCDETCWKTATVTDVQAELAASADVMARQHYGETPLHWTAGRGTL